MHHSFTQNKKENKNYQVDLSSLEMETYDFLGLEQLSGGEAAHRLNREPSSRVVRRDQTRFWLASFAIIEPLPPAACISHKPRDRIC